MINFRIWRRILWIVPITLLFSLNKFLSKEAGNLIEDLLLTSVFGQITGQGGRRFIFIAENLYFLILFNLLFGTHIYKDLQAYGAFLFTRLKKRSVWFTKRVLEISILAFLYSFLFTGIHLIACMRVSNAAFHADTAYIFLSICVKTALLLILTTLLINVGAIGIGGTRSYILVYIGTVLLIFTALKQTALPVILGHPWILALNPVCGILSEYAKSPRMQFLFMAFPMVFILCTYVLSAKYIERCDITLSDADGD